MDSRLKTVETLLGYLKAKARIMSASCGIGKRESMADLINQITTNLNSNCYHGTDDMASLDVATLHQTTKPDAEYVEENAVAVAKVAEVMELLLNRALAAEGQAEIEKEKFRVCDEEVKRKSRQIEGMWLRVEEMEKVAVGTSGILKEMQLKLEDMEHETSRQRQRANENEQELWRVRRDFGILKSSVDSLVKARETIRSMERRIQEVEIISERLTARVGGLEAGKRDSEAEIRKLLLENDKLRGNLDMKEAELAAASDHVKRLISMRSS